MFDMVKDSGPKCSVSVFAKPLMDLNHVWHE